ncbi:transcriptional regulator GcvA [Roseovarius aestuarii]|uniref:Glycine cleavage system transcriptional activator n=1 Tax=Roseovarius aestuarii TaxID=475083 RepID=A0A1X7BLJ1_9RHOB|nr:transcriptional regulator GcvA [Roseovarius aestuarii]SMC10497.1 Glycine cleavage system transcriptional activator [Roseovarius aestuarii]
MRKMPPLNSLKAFEASGRHLNFRLAAQELGVTQGAVAQQVRGLEELLKIKLFERHARGLSLTDEGRRYLPPIRRAFDMIAEATGNLSPKDTVVTISSTPSFATRWLVPKLGLFAQDHPDIRVRLDASNALANFQTDGVDIAIRQGKPPFGPGLVSELLFADELIAVCHPDIADGSNPIQSPEDLLTHVLLEDTHGQWPLFLEAALGELAVSDLKTMAFSQTSMAIDAAIAGQGVTLANQEFVQGDLQANRLCQPFSFSTTTEEGYHVVAPRNPRNPSIVAIVNDWFAKQSQP